MRSSAGTTRKLLESLAKRLVWSLTRVDPGAEDDSIALFTSRRSGGTWIMEMIGTQDGVRPLGQPLSIRQIAESELEIRIPIFEEGQLVTLDEGERERVAEYVRDLLSGRAIVNAPWDFWSSSFSWTADRLVLKLTGANSIIPWFEDRFSLPVVYLSRHPIPQSLSCMRLGWGLTAKAYLRNQEFVERYLTADQVSRSWDLLGSDDSLGQYVLNWALENLAPMERTPADTDWTWVSYEEAVVHPERTIRRLCRRLGLTDPRSMRAAVDRPSRTVVEGSAADDSLTQGSDRRFLIERWRERIDEERERSVMGVLEMLEIDHYVPGRSLPREPYLGSGASDRSAGSR